MRVLFLTPRALDDPRSGGTIKSAAVLDHLQERHEVDVACFASPGRGWTRSIGRTETVPLDRPRSTWRLVASYVHRMPLSIERNRSPEMQSVVASSIRDRRPDAIFVDGWLMAQYLPAGFGGRTLLHQHNAEHVMWRRQIDLERSPIRRPVLRLEASRVRRYEASILPRFDLVFAVSESDRAALLELRAGTPIRLLPNVPEPSLLSLPALSPPASHDLLSLGTLSWPPNVEGLVRFLREGLPRVRRVVADARLLIAGPGAPPSLRRLAQRTPGATLVGEVDEAESLYREARCFVDVGLGGSGTRVKVLNALARGLPVGATADAVRGLDVVPDEHVVVAEHPDGLARAIVRLLTDDEVWRSFRDRGRELIRTRYVPAVAFTSLDDALEKDRDAPPRRSA